MSEKRLSEIMAASSRAIEDAQEVLDEAVSNAINTYFDAGRAVERERIIKLLEDANQCPTKGDCTDQRCKTVWDAIALIKGENK